MADPKDPNSTKSTVGSQDVNTLKQIIELQELRLKNEEELKQKLQQQYKESERLFELTQKNGDAEKNHLDYTKDLIDNEKERIETNKALLRIQIQQLDKTKEDYKAQKEKLQNELQSLDLKKESLKAEEEINETHREFANSLSNDFKNITGIGAQSKSFLGSMIQLQSKAGGLNEALAGAVKNIANTLTPANLLAAAVDGIVGQTKKLFFEMDEAFSQFEKTAGGVDAFKGRIEDLRSSNVEYAVSIKEAAEAYSDLKVGFAGFAGVSAQTQDQLAQTTVQMKKLGVSSSETIKIQNMLVKGFQMSGEQAGNMQKQLMATAKAMGLPMQKVVGDFANASPAMKAHGSNMQKVFLDLQNQSKNLGIEFNKLQQITGKFDTFEGAADSAGQLNAILGGDYLNSLDLVNADEAERIRLMQEALKASGKSFEAMSNQERMAAAAALGLENATELQQFMNNEVEQGSVEALNKAEAEKELAKSVQDVTTMQEKLTAIMAQFSIVLTPVLDGIKSLLTTIGEWMSESDAFKYTVFALIGAFILLFAVLKGASLIGSLISGFSNFKGVITGTKKPVEDAGKGIGNALSNVAKGVSSLGRAAAKGAGGLLAFGLAMVLIGVSIAIAAMGLAKLVMAFQGLSGKQIIGALAALIITLGAMIVVIALLGALMVSGIGAAAALGILALGAAFLMMGAAVYIAADGISTIVKAMIPLAEILVGGLVKAFEMVVRLVEKMATMIVGAVLEGIKSFVDLIKTLGSMNVGNMLAMGPALLGIAGGLTAIAAAGVGSSVSGLITGAMGAIGSAAGLGSGAKNPLDTLVQLSSVVKTFPITEIEKITIAINKLIESLSKSISEDFVKNLKTVVEEVNDINMLKITALTTMSALNFATTAIPAAVAAVAGTNTAANNSNNAGQTNLVPVSIYIDSKKVGEILDPRVKQTIQDSLQNINGRIVPITG